MLCGIEGCKRIFDDPLTHWDAMPEAPAEPSENLKQAENSHCVSRVVQDARTRRISIQLTGPGNLTERRVRLQTDAGVLVGIDNGEWGGSLSLTGANGINSQCILDENVLQLLPTKSGILVCTGPCTWRLIRGRLSFLTKAAMEAGL